MRKGGVSNQSFSPRPPLPLDRFGALSKSLHFSELVSSFVNCVSNDALP